MFYNWKYCSFYPKNFGASALTPTEVHAYPDRNTCVPRPKYMRTPTEIHAYPDRGTCVSRSGYDNFLIFFRAFSDVFQSFFRCFLSFQKAPFISSSAPCVS